MNIRTYALVTAAYWAFTITDGALRTLVLFHFHELGYSPVSLGFLFLFYEFFGVLTNAIGGWLGSRFGLQRTLYAGLALQVVALLVLSFQDPGWVEVVSVAYVMGAQALSGIAKDLTKMSSKTAIKFVVADGDDGSSGLFRWVALLTGSKNALKGVGFFLGGALLVRLGYGDALRLMAGVLFVVLIGVLASLRIDIGRSSAPTSLRASLAKSSAVNRLSFARIFLFGARDIWFVVALPVYLNEVLGWSFDAIGAFLAAWVIGYGGVQSLAPKLVGGRGDVVYAARRWAAALAAVALLIATALTFDLATRVAVIGGLIVFGLVFAVNSSVHSYLILAYTDHDKAATDVGFYYSANAIGRLIGTLLSGLIYLAGGLTAALWLSAAWLGVAWLVATNLPPVSSSNPMRHTTP